MLTGNKFMERFVITACCCAGVLMGADIPVKDVPYAGTGLQEPRVGLSSMSLVMGGPFTFLTTHIDLYCVFPGPAMLVPEQPEQELTVTDSNGVRLRVRSIRLWEGWIKDKRLRKAKVRINLKDIPSRGARWIRVKGTLFLPLCHGLETLDFGKVELKESGASIPVPDPTAVRRALENNNRIEIADMAQMETVTLKVTRLEGAKRHAPANESGEEWKFMVYSEMYADKMFLAQDFLFHDMKGAKLNPLRTCHYTHHENRGQSFLFKESPRFVEVAVLYLGPSRISPVPVDLKIGMGGVMAAALPAPQEESRTDSCSR